MALASLLAGFVEGDLPIAIEAYDGSRAGPPDAPATVIVRSPDAMSRVVTRPGELGIARAYVAGDIDIEGDVFALLQFAADASELRLDGRLLGGLLRITGVNALRPLPPPPEEVRLRGGLHTRSRDRDAISHHYDVSNDFYRLVLGDSMTYSCAVFADPSDSLEVAQQNKYELISRKLGLERDMRLLDVGCGWGGMLLHAGTAPRRARCRGDPLAAAGRPGDQADRRGRHDRSPRGPPAGLPRRPTTGPSTRSARSACSSTSAGRGCSSTSRVCINCCHPVVVCSTMPSVDPATRSPTRRWAARRRAARRVAGAVGSRTTSKIHSGFMERYVFPDGELHEVGVVVSMLQETGFEVRHVETLREHYALDAAPLGRQPRGQLGRSSCRGGRRSGAGVAPLHGRVRVGLRAQRPAGPSGAGRRDRRRPQRHAPASCVLSSKHQPTDTFLHGRRLLPPCPTPMPYTQTLCCP